MKNENADKDKNGLRKIYRKSWPFDNIFGSSRFDLSPADRGIWNDLIDLGKLSRVKPGVVAAAENVPYTHAWLSGLLNCTVEEFDHALKVLADTGRVRENGAGIEILNWHLYQTDYDRQKPFRRAPKVKKWCVPCGWEGETSRKTCPNCHSELRLMTQRGPRE